MFDRQQMGIVMFKFSNILGLRQPAHSLTEPQANLLQLTNEQAMTVAAGNTEPTVKETPTDKPAAATTNNTYEPPTLPASGAQRPPFN